MARKDTWRAMARDLAARMENHSHLACGHHPDDVEKTAGHCPHCRDRAVYLRWVRREERAQALERVRRVNNLVSE